MSAPFDPYQAWLGIPRQEQPPHHYRLLGIAPLEGNPAVIQGAAERQTKILQMQAVGPYVALALQICGEVAAARHCLLTPTTKGAYDARLGPLLAKGGAPPAKAIPAAVSLPAAAAALRPVPVPQSESTKTAANSAAPAFLVSEEARPAPSKSATTFSQRQSGPGNSTASRSALELAKVVAGGVAGLCIAVLILNYCVGIDPLGWSAKTRKEQGSSKKIAASKIPAAGQPRIPSNPFSGAEIRNPGMSGSEEPIQVFAPDRGQPPENGLALSPTTGNRSPAAPPEENSPTEEPRSLADLTKSGSKSPSVKVKKSPLPSAAEQASKLAEIKDIYKTEFSATKQGGNPDFVKFLLATAAKVEDDPIARFVLCTEAFKQACAGSDFEAAADSLDRLESDFESDPFAARYELLSTMALGAKSFDERLIVATGALLLLDNAIALGKMEEADKLARIADTQTKIIIDKELRAKAVAALQSTSELATDRNAAAEAQEKLAQSPNDPVANLAVGRFLCFVEGNWPGGLPHLAKSGDDAVQGAAALDLTGPSGEVTAGKIGDAWYDLARSGKGQNFYGRADFWYQKGIEAESGLALIRLKKRHEEISGLKLSPRIPGQVREQLLWPTARDLVNGGSDLPSMDLLPLTISQTARPLQGWTKKGNSVTSPAAAQSGYGFFECSLQPPRREYSLQARIRRRVDQDAMGNQAGFVMFGLTQKGHRFALVIDDVSTSGRRMAYLTMGSAGESQNTSVVFYPQIKLRSDDVFCNVASGKITVFLNGTLLLEYSGDMSALALPPNSKYLPEKSFYYAQQYGINEIERWSVGPLARNHVPPSPLPPSDKSPDGPRAGVPGQR